MGSKCIYKDCGKTRRANPGIRIFSFPVKDKERCERWILNSGYEISIQNMSPSQLNLLRLCECHFEAADFINPSKHRLVHNAVPKPCKGLVVVKEESKIIPDFEQIFIVSEPYEEIAPSTTLYEDEPLLLKRTKDTKTYLKKT